MLDAGGRARTLSLSLPSTSSPSLRSTDPQVVAEAWHAWRAEVDFAERFVAEAPSLDITGDDPLNQHGSGGGSMSLREVPVSTIWEYGRHMGHIDLLRERIDGRIGP